MFFDKTKVYFTITENVAKKGGGVYAISSILNHDGSAEDGRVVRFLFSANHAEIEGGGMYLEANSKVYVVKNQIEKISNLALTRINFFEQLFLYCHLQS